MKGLGVVLRKRPSDSPECVCPCQRLSARGLWLFLFNRWSWKGAEKDQQARDGNCPRTKSAASGGSSSRQEPSPGTAPRHAASVSCHLPPAPPGPRSRPGHATCRLHTQLTSVGNAQLAASNGALSSRWPADVPASPCQLSLPGVSEVEITSFQRAGMGRWERQTVEREVNMLCLCP